MQRYAKAARATGRVVNVTDYGAFVELEPGLEGLIHITEMSWSKRLKHPSKLLKVGRGVEAVVPQCRDRRAADFTEHQADYSPTPGSTLNERYTVGTDGRRPRSQSDHPTGPSSRWKKASTA